MYKIICNNPDCMIYQNHAGYLETPTLGGGCLQCQIQPLETIPSVEIDLSSLYATTAKLSDLDKYLNKARALAGEGIRSGADIILTGQAPIWLYLKVAHALHGMARRLIYRSPVTGDVVIFDHRPD